MHVILACALTVGSSGDLVRKFDALRSRLEAAESSLQKLLTGAASGCGHLPHAVAEPARDIRPVEGAECRVAWHSRDSQEPFPEADVIFTDDVEIVPYGEVRGRVVHVDGTPFTEAPQELVGLKDEVTARLGRKRS